MDIILKYNKGINNEKLFEEKYNKKINNNNIYKVNLEKKNNLNIQENEFKFIYNNLINKLKIKL